MKRLLLVLLMVVFLPACGEKQLRKTLIAFEESTIVFPKTLLLLKQGRLTDSTLVNNSYRFIIYIPPTECSTCRINHLSEDAELFELASQCLFDLCVIFSPEQEELPSLINDLNLLSYDYPIWLDSQSEFYQTNSPSIPSDQRFHYFLIDSEGHPVLVGNPARSPKIKNLLINLLHYEEK